MKHDMLLGITLGVIAGLVFGSSLVAYTPAIILFGVLLLFKVITTK